MESAPDQPGLTTTSGYHQVIRRVAPMLGLEPRLDLPPADQLILANMKQATR